jgi:hypothetical protein
VRICASDCTPLTVSVSGGATPARLWRISLSMSRTISRVDGAHLGDPHRGLGLKGVGQVGEDLAGEHGVQVRGDRRDRLRRLAAQTARDPLRRRRRLAAGAMCSWATREPSRACAARAGG